MSFSLHSRITSYNVCYTKLLRSVQSTQVDPVEVGEVGADVERKSVVGDPALHPDPDRGDLPPAGPDAGHAVDPLRLHA